MSNSDGLICVVDDDHSVRRALARMFRSVGFSVQTFRSADEFLDNQPVEEKMCLVLDIRMPGMGGLELVERLKESETYLPVILITGHEYMPRKTSPPVLACFHKPLSGDELLETIEAEFARNGSDN